MRTSKAPPTERHCALVAAASWPAEDHRPPIVLFLCPHGAARSLMAHGFFQHMVGGVGGPAVARSGGFELSSEVNPLVVQAMKERGIDISGEFPKPCTEESVRAATAVITMGCSDVCPILPDTYYEEWELDDPPGEGLAAVRIIRDQIEQRVLGLLTELGIARVAIPTDA